MVPFEITILGSSSALPAYGRHPSSQLVNHNEHYYLIDCGEGTQMQLERYELKKSKINQIFISHLHGDHIFGLMPLLTTYSLLRRERPLQIFGPAPLKSYLHQQLETLSADLSFPLHVHEIDDSRSDWIYEDKSIRVRTLALHHRVPTVGYYFEELKKPPSILPDQLEAYDVHINQIPQIKQGKAVVNQKGEMIPAYLLSVESPPPRSFAYCSDTKYLPELSSEIQGVNLLYHEATFAEALQSRADKTLHSTARQAAMVAKEASAQQLVIGHFSTRYKDLNVLLEEAQSIFPATRLAKEGLTFELPQPSDPQ